MAEAGHLVGPWALDRDAGAGEMHRQASPGLQPHVLTRAAGRSATHFGDNGRPSPRPRAEGAQRRERRLPQELAGVP
jgi:hypothetical protein